MNKLRYRMLLIGLIPLLGLIWATGTAYLEVKGQVDRLEAVGPLSQLAVKSGNLAHELQKERGTQVGLISSKGADRFRNLVAKQRKLSDPALQAFTDFLTDFDLSTHKPGLAKYLGSAQKSLAQLKAHRAKVDSLSVSVPENVKFYTGIIYDLIDTVGIIQEESPDPEVTQRLLAYRSLVWAKEHAGLERAIGAAIFNSGKFVPGVWARYLGLVEKQNAALHEFNVYSTPEQKTLFKNTVKGPDIDQVRAWRKVLLDVAQTNDTQGIDGATWFAKATQRINMMKAVEDALAEEIQTLAQQRLNETRAHANTIIGVDIAILIGALLVGGWLLRSTAGPLNQVTLELLAVAEGKDTVDLPNDIGGGNEVVALSEAAKTFLNNRLERVRLSEAAARHQQEAEEKRKEALEKMATTVGRETANALEEIRETSKTLSGMSSEMTDSAGLISDNAADMKSAADRSLQNTEMVAAAAEELSASIGEITRQIEQQRDIASRAAEEATKSSKTVEGLNDAASRIGDVINLIQDIAEQTNLLALNATIEAARAGEAGKGFAVVASEVKNLANQTAKATEEISQQVTTMTDVTTASTEAINAIVKVIGEMGEISEMVSDAIEQQASATREITGNVTQSTAMSREVSERIDSVTEATHASRALAEKLGAASSDVVRNTENMQDKIMAAVNRASGTA